MNKGLSPTFSTFKGGYDSGFIVDGKPKTDVWSYTCLWGYLRLCYNGSELKNNWKHISLHGRACNFFGWDIVPVSSSTKFKHLVFDIVNFNWHFAFNKKWPFMKIGFTNIWKMYKDEYR